MSRAAASPTTPRSCRPPCPTAIRSWSGIHWDLGSGRDFFDDESSAWQPEAAIPAFFQDCDDDTAHWAASRLRRQYWAYWDEPNPLTAWPEGECQAVICREDRLVGLDWARRTLPAELDVTPMELPGGHSPFLSRPAELADVLVASLP